MFKLIGFAFGVVLVAGGSLWLFNTKLSPNEQQVVQQQLETVAHSSTMLVEQFQQQDVVSEPEPEYQESADAMPVAQVDSKEAEAKAEPDSPPPPVHEPEWFADEVDEAPSTPSQLASVWPPFNTRTQAQGFATYLVEKSGEPVKVIERHLKYYLVVDYVDDQALAQSITNLKQYANGLELNFLESLE